MPAPAREAARISVEQARLLDDQELQKATQLYSKQMAEWEKVKKMGRRILDGDHKAYTETLVELNPFAEISDLGSAIHFTVHTARLAECVLKVNGSQAIPAQVKTLTSSGKLSVKPMPKGRFHEIYQDYLCACVLRVARELFALLPLDALLVTAAADSLDPGTGQTVEQPVLSVFMPRAALARQDFERLDPSDAMDNFLHRGDLKASRKSEGFRSIAPLTPADVEHTSIEDLGFLDLLANVHKMRDELKSKTAELSQCALETILQTS
jgi:hypothetical protein